MRNQWHKGALIPDLASGWCRRSEVVLHFFGYRFSVQFIWTLVMGGCPSTSSKAGRHRVACKHLSGDLGWLARVEVH